MTLRCKRGELGPFVVWAKENSVSSFNPEKKTFDLQKICLKGRHRGGRVETTHLKIKTRSFDKQNWLNPWSPNSKTTSHRFDALFAAHTIEKYFDYLSSINAFGSGLDKTLFKKKILVEIITDDFPNATFNSYYYSLDFGHVKNVCSFSADADIIIHELTHLLTWSVNSYMGISYTDIESHAMNESLSDAASAIYFLNPVIGESLSVCLGDAQQLSPQNGIRRLDKTQGTLFYDEEAHTRTELYAPFLWFTFVGLTQLLEKSVKNKEAAKSKARDIMLILIHNMPKLLPFVPQKEDFITALYNALYEFTRRPDFQNKYKFNTGDFIKIIEHEASVRRLVKSGEEAKNALRLLPRINNPEEVIDRLTSKDITFNLSRLQDGQLFFHQHYKGKQAWMYGVRFVKAFDGYYVFYNLRPEIKETSSNKTITPSQAWAIAKSPLTAKNVLEILKPAINFKLVGKSEISSIINTLASLEGSKPLPHKLSFMAGKTALQYEFDLKDFTLFIDTVDGKASILRKKYY